MHTPQQQIDAYLGPGWYAEWQTMDRQKADEERRYSINRGRLNISVISPIHDRIRGDLDILDGVSTDYHRGLELIGQGRRVAKDKVGKIHDFYTLALGVVETENDMLDAMFATGFAAAWVMFPFAMLEYQSQGLLTAIDELKKALHEAEKEARNAKVKTAIHGVLNVFEVLVPELSLTARAGIFLGEVLVNKALGPSDPSKFQRYETIVTPGTKQFAEAVHHIEAYEETTRAAAKNAGHVATVATFYFDVHEMGEASEVVEKIKNRLERAKAAYDKLQKVIKDNQGKLKLFLAAFERWMAAIKDIRLTAANIRDARTRDMAAAGYNPKSMYAWPVFP